MLQQGAQGRSARRLGLVLGVVYALVFVTPDLAVGTVVRPIASATRSGAAHFAPWYAAPKAPAGTLRSPLEQRAAPRAEPSSPGDGKHDLSRPPDPLTRLVHAHVAQYGGDLDALTSMDVGPATPSAGPQK